MHLSRVSLSSIVILSSAVELAERDFTAKNFLCVNKAESGIWQRRGGKIRSMQQNIMGGDDKRAERTAMVTWTNTHRYQTVLAPITL